MLAARCRRSAPIVPGLESTSGAREVTLKYQMELPTTGDEPTKGNVARGKKFGAPGEVPFYPRGNAASKRGARTRTFPPGLRSNPKHTILNFTYL